ncbi:MAG: hypothetical protein GC145_13600 [Caulobacter sp.]|nr:hypothetical protein [Caulobacter sp.]
MILAVALALAFQAAPATQPATANPPQPAAATRPADQQGEDDEDWGVADYLNRPPAAAAESDPAAANLAAIERAEAARREANAPASVEESQAGRRCHSTPNGFVCGTSEKARKQSETLLNNMLNRPD